MLKDNKIYLPSSFNDGTPVSVAIVGLGGSGGEMLENLVRINQVLKELGGGGFDISLYDGDTVSHSNIGRTKFTVADVGMYKVDVLATKYNLYYGLDIKAFPVNFKVTDKVVGEYDLIITCTDSASFRCELGKFSEELRDGYDTEHTYWLDMGNTDYLGQYVLGYIGLDFEENNFIPNIYDLYKKELEKAITTEVDKPTCSLIEAIEIQSLMINKAVALHSSSLLFQWFRTGAISTHGGFIDLNTHEVKPLMINEKVWEFLVKN